MKKNRIDCSTEDSLNSAQNPSRTNISANTHFFEVPTGNISPWENLQTPRLNSNTVSALLLIFQLRPKYSANEILKKLDPIMILHHFPLPINIHLFQFKYSTISVQRGNSRKNFDWLYTFLKSSHGSIQVCLLWNSLKVLNFENR